MATAGSIVVSLLAATGSFETDLQRASRTADREAKRISQSAKQHAQETERAWSGASRAITAALGAVSVGAIFTRLTQNTINAANEQAQLAAVLRSTGEAAGWSATQLNELAARISRASTLSAGEINQAQTTLLAFTGIVGDQFTKALQAAVDMAARTGMSVVSAAETIGRALDIPSQGLAALSRQGFRFTDDQKKLAEQLESTGRTAEAQQIILSALTESYGGAAEAARNTLGGALAALGNSFDDLLTGSERAFTPIVAGIESINDLLASGHAETALRALSVAVIGVSTVFAGRLVGSVTASAMAFGAATAEAARYQATLARMAGVSAGAAAGIGAMSAATRAASGLMAIMGGPVGLAATLGLTAAAFLAMGRDAKAAATDVDELTRSFETLNQRQLESAAFNLENELVELSSQAEGHGQILQGLRNDYDALSQAQGVTEGELRNVRQAIRDEEEAFESVIATIAKKSPLLAQITQRLWDLDTASRGAAGGVDTLNRAMGFSEAGEKYLAQIQGRIKALQDAGDPIKIASRYIAEHTELTEADRVAIMSAAHAEKALIAARDAAAKATKAGTNAINEAKRAAEAFRREQDQGLRAQFQAVSAIHQQAGALEDQVLLFGQSKTALEDLTIARLEEQAALLRMYGDRSKDAVEAIEREIEARKRLRTAIGSMEQKEAEKAAWESWASDVEQIFGRVGQSLTDAIFEGGKSAKELLRDVFKGLTFNVLINPVMQAGQQWITNQLGGLFGYQNPQQGGGILGLAQHANTLNTLAGGVSQWMNGASVGASNLSLGYANTVGMFGGDSIGALIQANGGWEGALSGLSSATSAAVTAGALSAAPSVAASLSTSFGTAATTMASTSFTASLGGGAAAAGAGGAGGLMAGLSTAAPYVGAAIAVAGALGLFDDREPTTRREQRTQVEYADGLLDITKRDDRVQAGADAAVAQMTAAAIQSANSLFQNIGVDAAIESFRSIMASSYKRDRDGVASGGTLRVGDRLIDFGITDDTNPTLGGFGGWSSVDPMQRIGTEIQLSMLEALKAVSDELPSVLSSMLDVDIRSLDEAGAADLVARFTAVTEGASAFLAAIEQMPFDYLRDVTFDAAANMVQFAGGLDNLLAAHQTYYERFYSDAERHAHSVDQLSEALAGVGVEMPALTGSTDDMLASYRALAEAQDRNTEEGQRAYVMLMMTAGAFADVAQFAGQAAADLERAAEEQRRLAEEQRKYQQQAAAEQWSIVVAAGEAAYSALTRSVAAEKTRLQRESEAIATALRNSITAASSTVSELTSLTGRLTSTVQRMVGQGLDAGRNREWAQARIERALSVAKLTGVMPSGDEFEHALQIVAQPSQGLFDSFEDYQADFLKSAHDVSKLNELAGAQLTTEQRTLESLQAQLTQSQEWYQAEIGRLDEMLEYQRQQLDMALGQHEALLSIPAALAGIASAISNIQITAAATNYGGGGGGGGGGGNSYYDAKLAQLKSIGSTHGGIDWSRATTGDLAAYFAQEGLTPQEHWEKWGKYEGLARPSFAVGTNYVPYDMTADIHRGERIIPAADNRALIQALQNGNRSDNEIKLLRQELREMKLMQQRLLDEIAQNTYDTSRTNREMTETPQPVRVTNVVPTVEATIGS